LTVRINSGKLVFYATDIRDCKLANAKIEVFSPSEEKLLAIECNEAELRFDAKNRGLLVHVHEADVYFCDGGASRIESKVIEYEMPEPILATIWNTFREIATRK
jgi:hypothetical protein